MHTTCIFILIFCRSKTIINTFSPYDHIGPTLKLKSPEAGLGRVLHWHYNHSFMCGIKEEHFLWFYTFALYAILVLPPYDLNPWPMGQGFHNSGRQLHGHLNLEPGTGIQFISYYHIVEEKKKLSYDLTHCRACGTQIPEPLAHWPWISQFW